MDESLQGFYETLSEMLNSDEDRYALNAEQYEPYQKFCLKWLTRNMRNFPHIVKSKHEMGILYSEVFYQVTNTIDEYDPEERTFEVWLKGVIRNVCLKAMHKDKRMRERHEMDDVDEKLARVPDKDLAIDLRLELKEDLLALREAVDRLPKDLRDVIECRVYQDLDSDETAEALGISKDKVYKRYNRAKSALTKLLLTEKH